MSMNSSSESGLVPEAALRAALRTYQVDADRFEAGVRERIRAEEIAASNSPLARAPQLLKVAAAMLPLPFMAGGKMAGGPLFLFLGKLLGSVAMPAISLFVVLGAALFGSAGIWRVQRNNSPDVADQNAERIALQQWWERHRRPVALLFVITVGLPLVGATSLMLLTYLVSLLAMLYLLAGMARLGLGNRQLIARSLSVGLMFLGQAAALPSFGWNDIHFVDQLLLPAMFFCGVLLLLPFADSNEPISAAWDRNQGWLAGIGWLLFAMQGIGTLLLWMLNLRPLFRILLINITLLLVWFMYQRLRMGAFPFRTTRSRVVMVPLVIVPIIVWFSHIIWWPATPARTRSFVEAFDRAPYSASSWQRWEIVARWTMDTGLDPDLSRPRKLLEAELTKKNSPLRPYILGSAFRTDLVRTEDRQALVDLDRERESLLSGLPNTPITSLAQRDWVIRALAMWQELSPAERDLLEQRLLATMDQLADGEADVLEESLRVTQLLAVIRRPIDLDRYREQVHRLLRRHHSLAGGGFQLPGGFIQYRAVSVGSLEQTSHAVELMQHYGVPAGLDLNWVRSFLRPLIYRPQQGKYLAAVTLERLNNLPNAASPTWSDYLFYERSMLIAAVLIALCYVATVTSPRCAPATSASVGASEGAN